MKLETTMRQTAVRQKSARLPNQLPHLWPELGTEVKSQLAFSWAQLIVHVREAQDLEARNDRGRYR